VCSITNYSCKMTYEMSGCTSATDKAIPSDPLNYQITITLHLNSYFSAIKIK
jgi:hypothetical protein